MAHTRYTIQPENDAETLILKNTVVERWATMEWMRSLWSRVAKVGNIEMLSRAPLLSTRIKYNLVKTVECKSLSNLVYDVPQKFTLALLNGNQSVCTRSLALQASMQYCLACECFTREVPFCWLCTFIRAPLYYGGNNAELKAMIHLDLAAVLPSNSSAICS